MPRGPRLDGTGALHHVMVRGIERRRRFHGDTDRGDFLVPLGRVATDGAALVVAWSMLQKTPPENLLKLSDSVRLTAQ
jgi:putative transposase